MNEIWRCIGFGVRSQFQVPTLPRRGILFVKLTESTVGDQLDFGSGLLRKLTIRVSCGESRGRLEIPYLPVAVASPVASLYLIHLK